MGRRAVPSPGKSSRPRAFSPGARRGVGAEDFFARGWRRGPTGEAKQVEEGASHVCQDEFFEVDLEFFDPDLEFFEVRAESRPLAERKAPTPSHPDRRRRDRDPARLGHPPFCVAQMWLMHRSFGLQQFAAVTHLSYVAEQPEGGWPTHWY